MAFRHALFALLPLPRIYRRRVWHPAIPTPPSQGVQQSLLHQPSTRAPTLQSSHRIHGTHRNFWQRRASHGCSQMVWLRRVLPRNSRNTDVLSGGAAVSAAPTEHSCTNIVILPQKSQNTQKLLAEKSLPRMHTDAHRWLGCVGFCGKIVWLAAWVWQGCHTLLICAICGRISCIRNFCGFCGFCGKILWCLRGYGRDAIPS